MDDSVIKVLRRNGSWQGTSKKRTLSSSINKKSAQEETDFILDEKFGILAQEIKKRMKIKTSKVSRKELLDNISFDTGESHSVEQKNIHIDSIKNVKVKLLPFLQEIQKLSNEKIVFQNNIKEVDRKMIHIKNTILEIKKEYEEKLTKMKKNLEFFDNSLNLITDITEDK